jgi:hypothetical protein
MRPLVLKRASASRPSGQWQNEDYDVLADAKVGGLLPDGPASGGPQGSREEPPKKEGLSESVQEHVSCLRISLSAPELVQNFVALLLAPVRFIRIAD